MIYKKFKHAALDTSFPKMEPIKNKIPDFYKNTKTSYNANVNKLPIEHNFKACAVFSDAFMTGYSIPLVADIAVEQTENGPVITWVEGNYTVLRERPEGPNSSLPTPMGCSNSHFVWVNQNIFEIPKGYSALVTHPFNRHDLPFVTLTGILDSFVLFSGQIPVYFSSTFEGIIPQGTPIMQVLLFKKENWKAVLDQDILKIAEKNGFSSGSKAFGWYKQNIWQKKDFQ